MKLLASRYRSPMRRSWRDSSSSISGDLAHRSLLGGTLLGQLVVSGWILAFINSFDEVTMTVFITSSATTTLPVRLFLYIQDNIDPLVTSVSACVIAITVVALVALDRAYGLERLLVGRGVDGR